MSGDVPFVDVRDAAVHFKLRQSGLDYPGGGNVAENKAPDPWRAWDDQHDQTGRLVQTGWRGVQTIMGPIAEALRRAPVVQIVGRPGSGKTCASLLLGRLWAQGTADHALWLQLGYDVDDLQGPDVKQHDSQLPSARRPLALYAPAREIKLSAFRDQLRNLAGCSVLWIVDDAHEAPDLVADLIRIVADESDGDLPQRVVLATWSRVPLDGDVRTLELDLVADTVRLALGRAGLAVRPELVDALLARTSAIGLGAILWAARSRPDLLDRPEDLSAQWAHEWLSRLTAEQREWVETLALLDYFSAPWPDDLVTSKLLQTLAATGLAVNDGGWRCSSSELAETICRGLTDNPEARLRDALGRLLVASPLVSPRVAAKLRRKPDAAFIRRFPTADNETLRRVLAAIGSSLAVALLDPRIPPRDAGKALRRLTRAKVDISDALRTLRARPAIVNPADPASCLAAMELATLAHDEVELRRVTYLFVSGAIADALLALPPLEAGVYLHAITEVDPHVAVDIRSRYLLVSLPRAAPSRLWKQLSELARKAPEPALAVVERLPGHVLANAARRAPAWCAIAVRGLQPHSHQATRILGRHLRGQTLDEADVVGWTSHYNVVRWIELCSRIERPDLVELDVVLAQARVAIAVGSEAVVTDLCQVTSAVDAPGLQRAVAAQIMIRLEGPAHHRTHGAGLQGLLEIASAQRADGDEVLLTALSTINHIIDRETRGEPLLSGKQRANLIFSATAWLTFDPRASAHRARTDARAAIRDLARDALLYVEDRPEIRGAYLALAGIAGHAVGREQLAVRLANSTDEEIAGYALSLPMTAGQLWAVSRLPSDPARARWMDGLMRALQRLIDDPTARERWQPRLDLTALILRSAARALGGPAAAAIERHAAALGRPPKPRRKR